MSYPRSKDKDLPSRVYRKHGSFWFVDPSKKWHKLAPLNDLTLALRKYAELVTPALANATTVAGIINKYLADKQTLAQKTRKEYERSSKILAIAFEGFQASEVEPHHVWQYLQTRLKQGAGVSGNREKALLSTAFTHAMRHGIVSSNPCLGIGGNKETPRTRLVSNEELEKFLAWARSLKHGALSTDKDSSYSSDKSLLSAALIASIMEITYLCAQRRQSVLPLTLDDIAHEEGIEFKQQKTNVRVLVEWTPRLHMAVENAKALPRPADCQLVFAKHNGKPYSDSGVSTLLQRLMQAWELAGNTRFTIHDMRAKAITQLKADGKEAKNVSGHKTDKSIDSTYDRRHIRRGTAVE
ncbi:MAG: tyrosine-type recombinase/integrase [Proteobacteria bacterium]|nr:tyrosine-type recombinase/integrase [Pseudomonadota bacterium]